MPAPQRDKNSSGYACCVHFVVGESERWFTFHQLLQGVGLIMRHKLLLGSLHLKVGIHLLHSHESVNLILTLNTSHVLFTVQLLAGGSTDRHKTLKNHGTQQVVGACFENLKRYFFLKIS